MGGRGSGSGLSSSGPAIKGLIDSMDFKTFIRDNMSNPEFKKYGQDNGIEAVRTLWYDTRIEQEMNNLFRMDDYDAAEMVRDNIPRNVLDGWFRSANSDYKPKLMDAIVSNPGTYNAGLNIAYSNYLATTNSSNPLSFNTWIKTPQTMYRGDYGQSTVSSDLFTSFTPTLSVAQSFGSNITTRKIRPIDTWGSYQTTGEQEFLVPVR